MQLNLRSLVLRSSLSAAALALAIGGGAAALAAPSAQSHGNHGHDSHVTNGQASLRHTPDGNATLSWNSSTKDLTVSITMTGLAPNSTHPAQIRAGSCNNLGAVLNALTNVAADAQGKGTSQTTLHNVTGGIPGHGWALTVQNTAGTINLACGRVDGAHALKRHQNHHSAPTTTQNAHVKLGPTKDADQHAGGDAHLKLDGNTLKVKLNMHGLSQGAHAALIGQGSCAAFGAKAFDLLALTPNAGGHDTSETTIPNVSAIPNSGWYVAVYRGATATGDIIACGNVRVGSHD